MALKTVAQSPGGSRIVAAVRSELWARITFTLALAGTAFFVQTIVNTGRAVGGSYTVYLMVVPVLVALIAAGVPPAPSVADTEFDWIVAVTVAAVGFLSIRLLSQRLPTLAGLWNWDHFALPIAAIATATVVLSVRHMLRLWRAWMFALLCAPLMPYLLLTAQLGGTEQDAVVVAAGLGTVALYLSTSAGRLPFRLIVSVLNFLTAVGVDRLIGLDSVLLRIVIAAGVIPVLSTVAIHAAARFGDAQPFAPATAKFPRLGRASYATLVLLAVTLLLTSLPMPKTVPLPLAQGGWVAQLNLQPAAEFDFIRRFIGPGTTLTRYGLPPQSANSAVAVDVITAPNLARLRDYDHAVWYPSDSPVNYQTMDLAGALPATVGTTPATVAMKWAQSDPDSTSDALSERWYALTWLWRLEPDYQRVTVVINQDLESQSPPPAPGPLSWTTTLIEPALWLTRQQPPATGVVPKRVTRAAAEIAAEILTAGGPR